MKLWWRTSICHFWPLTYAKISCPLYFWRMLRGKWCLTAYSYSCVCPGKKKQILNMWYVATYDIANILWHMSRGDLEKWILSPNVICCNVSHCNICHNIVIIADELYVEDTKVSPISKCDTLKRITSQLYYGIWTGEKASPISQYDLLQRITLQHMQWYGYHCRWAICRGLKSESYLKIWYVATRHTATYAII